MRLVAALLRVACLALLVSSAAAAQSLPQLVSNVFQDTDLRQAISDVAAQAHVNIIADPSVAGVVTVDLENVTVDKALDLLLAGTGYQVQKNDDYYLVFNPDPASGMFTSVATNTKKVAVHYLSSDTARTMLSDPLQKYVRSDPASNTLAITAPADILNRILDDLASIDVPSLDSSSFIALSYVKATTALALLPDEMKRYVRADSDRNTLAISAPFGQRDAILKEIARLDVPRPAGSFDVPDAHPTQLVKLANARAATTLAMLPDAVRGFVKADEESNALAVSAPPVLVPTILKDIAAIDVPRKQIMLEAKVVVLERGDLLNFGGSWKWPEIDLGANFSDLGSPWELRIGYSPDRDFTNALSLTLNLLSQNNEASIIASPKVLAEDGRKAEIRVTNEEYFPITAQAGTITYVQSELQKIETGTILGITPQIGPDGKLTLDMQIEVSDVVARGDQGLPVVSRRIATSTVQIENGGTAAVAGLVDTRSQTGQSGVPGSNALPLLGQAFRTDTLDHRAQQVAVFVTATIVDQGSDQFATGRSKIPPVVSHPDSAAYRSELQSALTRLQQ
jgi:type II secretory pathway component GspD/PulD (secretin)